MNNIFRSDEEDWVESKGISAGGPFSVWTPPQKAGQVNMDWWCVCDKAGTNVLTRGTGQVFTSEQIANKIAEKWNG